MPQPIHVVVGVLTDTEGRALIARRPDHAHQGGRWEFPGGKLEGCETPAEALARELREELGIQVRASQPLIRVHHDYGDRRVLLDVYQVHRFSGTPQGREGQPLCWLHPNAMDPQAFPIADRPVIAALRLPDCMLITGADPHQRAQFLTQLRHALEAGIRLVRLRAPDLSPGAYRDLAASAMALCREHRALLLLSPPDDDPAPLAGAGLHLTSRRLMGPRPAPSHRPWPIGASCHDTAQLARAAELGLDYALLSPVLPTASHPDSPPLGWRRFAALTERARLPVYALGGLSRTDVPVARIHGAQGIAAIRGLWPSPTPVDP
jgi:8-oxo-dGTP diphosphatase